MFWRDDAKLFLFFVRRWRLDAYTYTHTHAHTGRESSSCRCIARTASPRLPKGRSSTWPRRGAKKRCRLLAIIVCIVLCHVGVLECSAIGGGEITGVSLLGVVVAVSRTITITSSIVFVRHHQCCHVHFHFLYHNGCCLKQNCV